MARFKCPQCGRRFGSVGDMLTHTERVHANAPLTGEAATHPSVPARGMPEPEPGPVAAERASHADFDVEPQRGEDVGTFERGPMEAEDEEEQKQNPALGTIIALVVIAIIIILNILGGSPE